MNKHAEAKRISTLLIALALVSLFAVSYTFLIADVSSKYGVSYNSTEFDSFNKLQDINTQTAALETKASEVKAQTGLLDRIGAMFEAGYGILKSSFSSMGLIKDMTSETFKRVDLGGLESYFNMTLVIIIVVTFVLGIIVSAIVKREV